MRIALLLVLVLASSPSVGAQTAPARRPLSLAELEQLAIQNNPTTAAAQASVDATRALARQAGAWPNPVIGYLGNKLSPTQRGEHGVYIDQAVPLGGRLGLARGVFDRAADRAAVGVDLQRQRILSSVRALFYRTLAAERQVEVDEKLARLVSEAVGVTGQLFNVGAADKPDHLEIEIESLRVGLALDAARNGLFALRQQLAAATGVVEVADRPLAGSIDDPIPDLERDALTRALVETSAQVRAARAEVQRAQAVTALARKQTSPELFLRGVVTFNRTLNAAGAPVGWQGEVETGLSLPLFNRNQGGIAAARADELRAAAELRRVELVLRAEAAAQFALYLTALREGEVYRTQILTRAEEAYRLYLARYQQMSAAYPQVLVAQQTLFARSREYLESLDRVWRAASSLQGLLAGDALNTPSTGAETMMTFVGSEGGRP